MRLVDACHRAGLGVILDWVPAHFPDDGHASRTSTGRISSSTRIRGSACIATGTRGSSNFGRNEVRNFLLASALFWLDKYHIDGLRVDAVASMLYLDYSRKEGEWVPNRFGGRENLEAVEFNPEIQRGRPPGVSGRPDDRGGVDRVAEWSHARRTWRLGFDLKWNMGWMHDMLDYMEKDPIYRRFHHQNITFSLLYAFTENFVLPLSHDEVVHLKRSMISKMPGDDWQKFANLRAFYGFMVGHPGKKLLFMGDEIGSGRNGITDRSLDWHLLGFEPHRGLQRWVRDLLHFYGAEPALHEIDFSWEGFEWVDFHDTDANVVAFIRRGKDSEESILIVSKPLPGPSPGIPARGSPSRLLQGGPQQHGAAYGGSNAGNLGASPPRRSRTRENPVPWR